MSRCVLLDVDGTLLKSNEAHARAWNEALAEEGYEVSVDDVLPLIGKGGDKVIPQVANLDPASEQGRRITDAQKRRFLEHHLPGLRPTRGARALLIRMREAGMRLVAATSSSAEQASALLEQAGVADLIDEVVTSSDAASSKPDPDIVLAALRKGGCSADEALLLGDTPWDVQAAQKAGVQVVALRCGGHTFEEGEALAVYEDPADVLANWEQSPFGNGGNMEKEHRPGSLEVETAPVHVIRRLGVASLTKVMGLLYAVLGLIFGALFALIAVAQGEVVGIFAAVLAPLFYGAIGVVVGFVVALLYNLIATTVGGIELELETWAEP